MCRPGRRTLLDGVHDRGGGRGRRLPDIEGDKPARKKFKSGPIGYFHIDIAEIRTAGSKLHLIAAVPHKLHTVLTDNRIPFKNREQDGHGHGAHLRPDSQDEG